MTSKNGIHSASSEKLEGKLKTRFSYLAKISYHLSPISVSILERLTQTQEHYQEHVLQDALFHYAKSQLPNTEFNELISEANSRIYPVEFFDKNRQICVFKSHLTDDELLSLSNSKSNNNSPFFLLNSEVNATIVKKLLHTFSFAIQSYYMQLDGYFPSDLETIEGLYIHALEPSKENGPIYTDASKDFSRQATIILVIESESSSLHLSGNNAPRIALSPGQIIILPTNFSATYRIIGDGKKVKMLKAFLHENEEDLN